MPSFRSHDHEEFPVVHEMRRGIDMRMEESMPKRALCEIRPMVMYIDAVDDDRSEYVLLYE